VSLAGTNYPACEFFTKELAALGYADARNIRMEARFADRVVERLPSLIAELIALPVDAIAIVGAATAKRVSAATKTIPLVFSIVVDPVAGGLVADARRPGGNMTGVTNFDPQQASTHMRMLKEIRPRLSSVAILGDANVPELLDRANEAAAQAEGLRPIMVRLRGPGEDIDAVFRSLVEQGAGAIVGLEVPAVGGHAKKIVAFANEARLPTLFSADSASEEPTIAYGTSFLETIARMAGVAVRVLNGKQPGEVPVEVVTNHKLTLNLKSATSIGAPIPQELLARADRVVK
jgi:putative ABC transport system substrate-binding protein